MFKCSSADHVKMEVGYNNSRLVILVKAKGAVIGSNKTKLK